MRLKIKSTKWALIFSFLSLFILGLADNIRGPLFPEILQSFNLSNTLGSYSFATTSGAAFLFSYFSTFYLSKFSITSLLSLSVFLMSLGLFLMGSSPSFAMLLVGSFILGASIGFMGVSQNLLVTENVTEDKKSRVLSALHGMYGLASFFAPVMAAKATLFFGEWRAAFIISAGLAFVFLIAQLIIRPEKDSLAMNKNLNSSQALGFDSKKNQNGASNQIISKKALVMIGGMFAFYVVAEILISSRLALYMRTYFNMNLQESSWYVTAFFLFLLLGRFLFAFIKLPFSLRAQLNGALILALVFLLLGLRLHPFFLALTGLGMAPYYPLSVSYISEISAEASRKFIAFAMSLQSLAVFSMHLGVGYLTDQLGLAFAFGVGVVALLISFLCLNFHPKKLFI